MSADAIRELQKNQDSHTIQIKSLETVIETVFPPLVEKIDKLADRLHENSEAINLSIQKSTSQGEVVTDAFDRVRKQQEKLESQQAKDREKFQLLSNEVIENRPILVAVKGLGNKLIGLAVIIIGSAVAIIMAQ